MLATSGCLIAPEIMIAADVVSAAMKAGVDYAEKSKPTPEQRWEQAKVERLERRALGGDVEAQYEMGLVLQAAHSAKAKQWICRAANNGLARAQAHMGHWYNEDRNREDIWPFIDIRPDNREAFVWYSLAEVNGDAMSVSYRDRLEKNAMDSAQVVDARGRLAEWSPGYCGSFSATTASAAAPSPPNRAAR